MGTFACRKDILGKERTKELVLPFFNVFTFCTQGLDWHGSSTQDVWEALTALSKILQANDAWKTQAFSADTRVHLLGHSNGGQGVWHVASHFPDRVIASKLQFS
jgi:alpha-beta hydrolase superfamily lysophospholipase